MLYLAAFFASFLNIGLRSFQQLNVMHRKYACILPVSMLMAVCEAVILLKVVHNGLGWVVLAIGLGGGLGSITSTFLHTKYFNKGK
jgi:hypothetical protein